MAVSGRNQNAGSIVNQGAPASAGVLFTEMIMKLEFSQEEVMQMVTNEVHRRMPSYTGQMNINFEVIPPDVAGQSGTMKVTVNLQDETLRY